MRHTRIDDAAVGRKLGISQQVLEARQFLDILQKATPLNYKPHQAIKPLGRKNLYVLDGWAAWTRTLSGGKRAILHLILPGEPLFGQAVGPNVFALTEVVLADLSASLAAAPAEVVSSIAAISQQREHFLLQSIARLSRLDAASRAANLFSELHYRLESLQLTSDNAFDFPMSQEQVGDMLGLSTIHVNRTYRLLESDGLVRFSRRRQVTVLDLPRLRSLGSFVEPA